MNKKIIAIAIATAMAAPVAMADVKVSGRVGGHLTMVPAGTDDPATVGIDEGASSRHFGDAGEGRLQFDGTSGKGFARIAFDTRPMMGGGSAGARDVYVGYKMGAGSLSLGRMAIAGKNAEKDPYIASFLQTRNGTAEAATAKQYGSSSFVNELIQFSTKAGGAAIKVQYNPTDNDGSSDGGYALSAAGKAGGLNFWVALNNGEGSVSGTSTEEQNAKVGAAMKFGSVKVSLNVTNAVAGPDTTTATAVTADMGLGDGLSANLGYAGRSTGNTWMRLAVAKKLNKGTKAYAGVTVDTPSVGDAVNVLGVGMVVKF